MLNCNFDCANCKAAKEHINPFDQLKTDYAQIKDFKYNFEQYSTPTSMLLGLTNRCNLSCPYCFVHQSPADMTLDTAISAVEWLKKNYQIKQNSPYEKHEMFVGFFGGEPLLRYNEIIVPLVEKYVNESNLSFGITTNGVLLDEDKVDFFYKHKVSVLLSFDGIECVQNTQRPGKNFNSFEKILQNIPYLLLRLPNTVMRSTITKESIPYLYDTVMMATELGFKGITFCPNAFEDWDEQTREDLYRQFDKIGRYIYTELKCNRTPIQVKPLTSFYNKLNEELKQELKFVNDVLRCGLGTTSCAITPAGEIIPCQEKTSNPTIILGHISTGINAEVHEKYLREVFNSINNIECSKGCSYKTKLICLSDLCPSRLEDLKYNLSTSSCAFTRAATSVATRLFYLCHYSPISIIRQYFEQEEVK